MGPIATPYSRVPPFQAKPHQNHSQHLRLMVEVEVLPRTSSPWAGTQCLPLDQLNTAHQPPCFDPPICPPWLPQSLPCFYPSVAHTAMRIMPRVLTLAFEALSTLEPHFSTLHSEPQPH